MKRYLGIIPLVIVFLSILALWLSPAVGLLTLLAVSLVLIVMVIWAIAVIIERYDSGEHKNELSGKLKLWLANFDLAFFLSFFLIRVPMLLYF